MKTPVNLPVDEADEERIRKQDQQWSGPKLVMLAAGVLAVAIAVLYAVAAWNFEARPV